MITTISRDVEISLLNNKTVELFLLSCFHYFLLFSDKKIGFLGHVTVIACPLQEPSPGWTGPPDGTTYKYAGSPDINPQLDRISLGENGDLIINNTQFSDAGQYICSYRKLEFITLIVQG